MAWHQTDDKPSPAPVMAQYSGTHVHNHYIYMDISNILIEEYAFVDVVCKMSLILFSL